MDNVIILGSTGMLGSCLSKYIPQAKQISREQVDATSCNVSQDLESVITSGDVVVNCVGVLKPDIEDTGRVNTIIINSVFPQIVSDVCRSKSARMIHICSDCVFSGEVGGYDENSLCDAVDLYGRTKSITPTGCDVIRTSFIGHHPNGKGLLEWVLSNKDSQIDGYTNCLWNGVTSLQLCKFICWCIDKDVSWTGLLNVFTASSMSKFELCSTINEVYDANVKINPVECDSVSGTPVYGVLDRRLSSSYGLQPIGRINDHLQIQIEQQREWYEQS
jgi:dTDP-4-dehydrorhamnose reductase